MASRIELVEENLATQVKDAYFALQRSPEGASLELLKDDWRLASGYAVHVLTEFAGGTRAQSVNYVADLLGHVPAQFRGEAAIDIVRYALDAPEEMRALLKPETNRHETPMSRLGPKSQGSVYLPSGVAEEDAFPWEIPEVAVRLHGKGASMRKGLDNLLYGSGGRHSSRSIGANDGADDYTLTRADQSDRVLPN